jgi:hypothetical protein
MRKLFWAAVLFCGGCSSPFIYAPNPQDVLDSSKAVQFSGLVARYEMGFSGVSVFDGHDVRLVVFGESGVKLADMRVTAGKTYVYYQLPKLPARAVKAFDTLARTYFFNVCPPEKILYYDKSLRADMEVRTQGVLCR